MEYIPSLVQPDQVGFVPGCQVPDPTRQLLNLIHHATHTQTPSLLLSLDAIPAAILSLYSNPSAKVLTGGPYPLRSKSQMKHDKCPLSPINFALLMEPLAMKIRADPRISGI